MTTTICDPEVLAQEWRALLVRSPRARIRDAAAELGVSEAQLLATRCGDGVTRLATDGRELFTELPRFETAMALTRNESAVIEKVGRYAEPSFKGHVGLVLGGAIDLRLFPGRWRHAFAVRDRLGDGETRVSFQVFDASGAAVHKAYPRGPEALGVFEAVAGELAGPDQARVQAVEPIPAPAEERSDEQVDVAGLRAGWLAMKDTHDFFPLMARAGVTRTQALRLAPEGHARRVRTDALQRVLEGSAAEGTSIMVFVGNHGAIQIHTGPIRKTVAHGPWFNVFDEEFNLHVRADHVAAAWIVRKPTADGIVSSLELFDERGCEIALLFGERKPGREELSAWRRLLETLPPQ